METRAWLTGLILCAALLVPSSAFAELGVGGDLLWIPASTQELERAPDADHGKKSLGISANAKLLSLPLLPFSMGLKLNYFNEGLELQGQSKRRNQLDVNGMARLSLPLGFKAFGEGGLSLNTDFSGVGYNVGLGAEYTFLEVAIVELNLGAMGQYVKVPTNILNDRKVESRRIMVFVGADIGI